MADPFGQYAKQVRIKNGPTTAAQRDILARAIRYAEKVHAPYKAKVALLTGLIQESEATNLSTPSADGYGSYGVMQGLVRYQSKAKLMSPEYQFGVFLGTVKNGDGNYNGFTGKGGAIKLSKTGMTTGQIAQAVNGSAYPARYQTTSKEAERILKFYAQGSGTSPSAVTSSPVTGGVAAPSGSTVTTGQDIMPLVNWIKNRNKGATVVDLANAVSAAKGTTVATTQGVDPTAAVADAVAKAKGAGSSSNPTSSGPGGNPGTGKPGTVYELVYDPQGGWTFGKRLPRSIGGHSDHVHVAADSQRIRWIGKQAQKMGLRVGENKAFSGSTPTSGHATNSYHYKNEAIDVSGSSQRMADFARWVRRSYNLQK